MEKILTIMKMSENPNANRELLLSYKIASKHHHKEDTVNFCIKCFAGHFVVEYHSRKKWGIVCDNCRFRIGCLEKAGAVSALKERCSDCQSFKLKVQYKDDSPFPGGAKTREACLLCDSVMRSTIVNFFFKSVKQKTPEELEEEQKRREEQKRIKEEKRALREAQGIKEEGKKKPVGEKKKKSGPNILSHEDRVAEFMKKMHGAAE